jgi:hypothetical protein
MDKKGCYITDNPCSPEEKEIFKNEAGDKIYSLEIFKAGLYILRQWHWMKDCRYIAQRGTWYEHDFHLNKEELEGLVSGLPHTEKPPRPGKLCESCAGFATCKMRDASRFCGAYTKK